jgi:hypothetical protein
VFHSQCFFRRWAKHLLYCFKLAFRLEFFLQLPTRLRLRLDCTPQLESRRGDVRGIRAKNLKLVNCDHAVVVQVGFFDDLSHAFHPHSCPVAASSNDAVPHMIR